MPAVNNQQFNGFDSFNISIVYVGALGCDSQRWIFIHKKAENAGNRRFISRLPRSLCNKLTHH